MAFTKTPVESTYRTEMVKLIMTNDNRDAAGTKDVIALNGFYEITNSEVAADRDYHFVKRDGAVEYAYTSPNVDVRGIYYWQTQNKLFVAYQSSIVILTATTGAVQTTLTPFSSTTGEVGFIEYRFPSGETKVVFTDGTVLGTIDSANTQVLNADADFPDPIIPGSMVYLDGYLFVVKSGTSDIYNSALDNPLSWDPSNFIAAEMGPDSVTKLARIKNYIVAMGPRSIEYFYNAANATGSPLNRYESFFKEIGFLGGFAQKENTIFFVGQAKETDPTVFAMTDSSASPIANTPLRRFLVPSSTFVGAVVSNGGKDFYVMDSSDLTYVFDMEANLWTRWAWKATDSFSIKYATKCFIPNVGNTTIMVFDGDASLYYFDPKIYQDDGVDFLVRVQTDKMAFNTMRQKTMSKIIVYADRPTVSALLSIRVSDDDYQTYSVARTVDINQEFPSLTRWGRFRRRSWDLQYQTNAPLRLRHLEVDINMGTK